VTADEPGWCLAYVDLPRDPDRTRGGVVSDIDSVNIVLLLVRAGFGLALGLLTPLCCAAGISLMAVAIFTVHRHSGFFILKEGWESTTLIAVTCLSIATLGPGDWSVDHGIDSAGTIDRKPNGWFGLWTALVVGVGSATGLLATFWRRA
jgi:putative oxidoreductase